MPSLASGLINSAGIIITPFREALGKGRVGRVGISQIELGLHSAYLGYLPDSISFI